MDSRRYAGAERARLHDISRRAMIAGTSVAAIGAATPAMAGAIPPAATLNAPDEGVRRCASWLAVNAKIERLQTRWANLEGWLAREHAWFQISSAQRQALPWAKELRDIDGYLDVLFERRDTLLARIPASGDPSTASVIARLAVVERLIWHDDLPEARGLIVGTRQDLVAIAARGGVVG